MIKRTSSYTILQTQVQSIFDFAVVVCHSVPALKLQMKLLDDGKITKLPDPDYFEANNPTTKLREQADGYKDKLATYLFLSSFAFFENYLGSALKEVLELSVTVPEKSALKSNLTNNTNTKPKKILRSSFDQRHLQRYDKYSRELDVTNYIHPDNLVSIIAIENLIKTITDLKANQIPDFLVNTIKMDISEADKNSFGTYWQLRNDIAHGDNPTVTMRKVKEANKFLRKFATKIDEFLMEHYVKIDNYKRWQTIEAQQVTAPTKIGGSVVKWSFVLRIMFSGGRKFCASKSPNLIAANRQAVNKLQLKPFKIKNSEYFRTGIGMRFMFFHGLTLIRI